ncbi:multicopper oxidase domain-containing protein [Sorangium sp. So ce117]|uniref:multicopper oxidase domain-containing protein n=1 Tax=Sorangium sp. So ce117 TaxID=3133277 RepID=UPI003F60FBD2
MGINGVPSWEAEPLVAAVGETAVWTIENTMEFDHPFHLHGFFFQVLGADGQPVRPLAWKDTVNVPVDGAARFAVRYDNRPGMWMFHCHILDHADAGMMGMLQVLR